VYNCLSEVNRLQLECCSCVMYISSH